MGSHSWLHTAVPTRECLAITQLVTTPHNNGCVCPKIIDINPYGSRYQSPGEGGEGQGSELFFRSQRGSPLHLIPWILRSTARPSTPSPLLEAGPGREAFGCPGKPRAAPRCGYGSYGVMGYQRWYLLSPGHLEGRSHQSAGGL